MKVEFIEVFHTVGQDTIAHIEAGILTSWTSLIVNKNFDTWDDFQLNVVFSKENMKMFATDNLLVIDNEAFYITSITCAKISDGLTIKGRSIFGRISDRMIMDGNINYYNKKPSDIAEDMINRQLISPSDPNRVITGLVKQNSSTVLNGVTVQQGYGQLDKFVTNLMTTYDFGVREKIVSRTSRFITQGYEFFTGNDVSSTVELSTDFQNLINPEFNDDIRDNKNFAMVAGEGDYPNRTIIITGNTSGNINRKELYVDARDLQKTTNNVTMSDTDYQAALIARGQEKLQAAIKIYTLNGELDVTSKLYELDSDFGLGSRVTIRSSDFNLSTTSKIIKIAYTFDKDGSVKSGAPSHVDLTFDKDTLPVFSF